MADLFNQQISATYSGLLKTSSSGVLSASLSQISDGRGNTSPLYLSTDSIQFYGAYSFPNADGSANQVLKTDGAGVLTWADDANTGTVTSVALSVPTGLTVTGSPITTNGTITIGGTLGVANGGTGATTLTGILVGNGTSAISVVSDGIVSGQVLSTNANGTYSFINAATGDVSISGTPSTNEVAIWTNSNTIKGDASFTMSSSTFQINNSTASSQSNLIISNNDTAINSIPANIIFNSNTLTSYKTLAQIYATKIDADIANASGKLNFSTTDAGVPSVKFIINSNGLSEFLGNVNAYNTSSLKLYSLGQEGYSNTEFLEIKKSSTNAIFNVNKVGTGSVRGLEFQTGNSPKLTISSNGETTISTTASNAQTALTLSTASSAASLNFSNTGTSPSNWYIQSGGGITGALRFYSNVSGSTGYRLSISSGGDATLNGYLKLGTSASQTILGDFGETNTYLINYNSGGTLKFLVGGGSTSNEKLTISSGGAIGQSVTPISDPYVAGAEQWMTYQIGKGGIIGAYKNNNESMFGFNTYTSAPSGNNKAVISGINGTAIRCYADQITFNHLTSLGTSQTQSTKLTISSGGEVTIPYYASSSITSLNVTSGGLLTTASSDISLKKDITNLNYGINEVLKLNPVSFYWIDNDYGTTREIGFVAQEIEEVVPEVVTENNLTKLKAVNYGKITSLLTKAIQEQQTIIEDLKSRIETLEG